MALVIFLFSIILTSFFLTDITIQKVNNTQSKENLPKIVFVDSTLYELNQQKVDKIIKAKEAIQYENKDELKNATLILRGPSDTTDIISGEYMKRENNIYQFNKNVVLKKGNDMELKTQSITYDDKTKIASNQSDFVFNYKSSAFIGNTLYVNKNDFAISGHQAHFVINEKDI